MDCQLQLWSYPLRSHKLEMDYGLATSWVSADEVLGLS